MMGITGPIQGPSTACSFDFSDLDEFPYKHWNADQSRISFWSILDFNKVTPKIRSASRKTAFAALEPVGRRAAGDQYSCCDPTANRSRSRQQLHGPGIIAILEILRQRSLEQWFVWNRM